MTIRERIDGFLKALFEMGPRYGLDRVAGDVVGKLAVEHGLTKDVALIEFTDACLRVYVDNWPFGLSAEQYRQQSSARFGRVKIWAAVIRFMDESESSPRTGGTGQAKSTEVADG